MAGYYVNRQLKLFSLSSNVEIAQKIANTVDVPLGKASACKSPDDEIMTNTREAVRRDGICIIQSISYPVNDNLWELLIVVNTCRRASASTVNVAVPRFGYSHQGCIAASREPITARLVTSMLVKADVDRLLTLDLHAVQVQGSFNVLVNSLLTVPLFAKYYCELELKGEDVVVVDPKDSGIKRTRSLAQYPDSPIAIIDYVEDGSHREEGYVISGVAGKKATLIDNILNTSKTFAKAAKTVERDGATEIYTVTSHSLSTGGVAESLDTAPIKKILVTGSVATKERLSKNIRHLSANKLTVDTIVRIHEKSPLSPLFSYNATKD